MRDAIYEFFDSDNIKSEDILLFYYSGHGVPDIDGDVYLATSETDPRYPYKRGFSFNEITKMMNRSVRSNNHDESACDTGYNSEAKQPEHVFINLFVEENRNSPDVDE